MKPPIEIVSCLNGATCNLQSSAQQMSGDRQGRPDLGHQELSTYVQIAGARAQKVRVLQLFPLSRSIAARTPTLKDRCKSYCNQEAAREHGKPSVLA
eukprot:1162002-Pelagomonas_calceolata.AAC.2